MPLYNVTVTYETTLVVVAEDEDHAIDVAYCNAQQDLRDANVYPEVHVTGEVRSEKHLSDGWDVECVPYGGDGNTRLRDLLAKPA